MNQAVKEEAGSREVRMGARRTIGSYVTQPVVRLLAKTPVTPNTITVVGTGIAIGAGVLIATGHPFAAGFVVLIGGFFDIIDGALARSTNRSTVFGAILDSTLDRVAEAVVLLGLLVFYAVEESVAGTVVVGLVWLTSLLVSYIRVRAEASGFECEVGLFTRTERVIVLALGLLLSQVGSVLLIALSLIAALSLLTAGQRLHHTWRQTKAR